MATTRRKREGEEERNRELWKQVLPPPLHPLRVHYAEIEMEIEKREREGRRRGVVGALFVQIDHQPMFVYI
jgi:hypothetical protein